MTEQPTTAAGRRFVATVAALFIDPDDDSPIDVTEGILAIEAEVRAQDTSALLDGECPACGHITIRDTALYEALAALPPSAPPALDVERVERVLFAVFPSDDATTSLIFEALARLKVDR